MNIDSMKNVLLVDDDQIFNFLSKKVLEHMNMGFKIHTTLNGRQALDFFKEGSAGSSPLPDLVLLDLNMPVMDGFDFMKAFNELDFPGKERILIIALSSSDNNSDVERIKNLGAKFYLSKPLEAESLITVIQ